MSVGRRAYLNGLAAEDIAARFYQAEGAELLASRWKCPEGEIDLIFGLGGCTIFVEVKARRNRDAAAAAIGPAQRRRLAAAATRWLAEHPDAGEDCRFDVVLVDRGGQAERIENAAISDDW